MLTLWKTLRRCSKPGRAGRGCGLTPPSLALSLCMVAVTSGPSLLAQRGQVSDSEGRLKVASEVMAGRCITMVSPHFPQLGSKEQKPTVVVVQVAISYSGSVSPLRAVSGPPAFEPEAMNAVRLWKYRPYTQDGAAQNVTTEVPVAFTPGKAGGLVLHPHP